MRFQRIAYLHFAKRSIDERPAAFNLASSGMEAASSADIGLDPPVVLPIAGSNAFGHPRLRARLAEFLGASPERVLLAQGASLANFLVMAAVLRAGDRALCERPVYEPLLRVLEALDARVSFFDRDPARGFAPDLDAIRRGLAAGARLVVLTDLHNPSAALLDRETVREIGALVRRHDAFALVDEVYLSGVFDRSVESAARLGERLIVTASLTKTFGLGPLRAGWAIAPPEVVARAQDVLDHLGVEPPFLADEVALRALDRIDSLRERARARREANWPIVRAFIEARGLRFADPAGGFVAWLALPHGADAEVFAARLRERRDTQVTPGSFFGVRDHVRIGFGGPTDVLKEGLRRFGAELDLL
jgi:aspartate/methionine/tyrosine aminotransferase